MDHSGYEQLSMTAMLDGYETALLPPEERKKDVKGWTVEAFPITNSFKANAPILYWVVRPRRIVFERDSKWDERYKCWDTFGHSLDGRYMGFYGGHGSMVVFSTKPSHADCFLFVRKEKRDWKPGEEIRYQGADTAAMVRGECDRYI